MNHVRYGVAWCASWVLLWTFASTAAAQPAPAGDSLKVVMCGTSGPLAVRDRAKPCVAVQAGGALYLVDIGPEATENLLLWRLPLATARAVFITHLHSDHIGGLGEFNMQSWVAGRSAPLAVAARQASIMTDTLSYHTTPVEAAEIAKAAGVKVLILSHLTQAGLPFFTPDAFTRGVDAVFTPWRLARDGMTIELPVGTAEIRYGQF
jgi:ribonuclease BN (tRNA processing enzyme)